MSQQRIAVLGGLGQIGSALCDTFKADGAHVTVFDNACQNAIAPVESTADLVHLEGLDALERFNKARYDYVFHCASPAGPARIKPGYALRQIIEGTEQGLEFAKWTGARFIKCSSSEVYSRAGMPLIESAPCWVDPRYDARSEYAIGFLGAECAAFNHAHPDVQVLRLFNVVGPRQRPESGCVIPRFIQQARAGEPLTVFNGGQQRRTFTWVGDFVEFCRALMRHWPTDKRIWNVANPANEISMDNLAKLVARKAGVRRLGIKRVSGTELTPHYRDAVEKVGVDIERARGIGWEPKVGMEEIVERCLAATLQSCAETGVIA